MGRNIKNQPSVSLKFGHSLKAARERAGLRHAELARRVDKSVGLLSMYETGQRFPPKTTLEAIERELRVDLRAVWEDTRKEWDKLISKRKSEKEATSKQPFNAQRPSATETAQRYAAIFEGENFQDLTPDDIEHLGFVLADAVAKIRAGRK
ncbi:MAG: helix-turn-helix domain-containing protein [Pyrinomonadaceae bacterium]